MTEDLEQLGAEIDAELAECGDAVERASHSGRFVIMASFLRALFWPYESGFVEFRAIGNDRAEGRPETKFLPIADLYEGGDKGALKQAYRECLNANEAGYGVYMGVLPRAVQRGREVDVTRAGWFWTDVDFKIAGEDAAYDAVFKGENEPDLVVCSGNGLHAYYHIDDCNYLLDTKEQRTRFKVMLSRFQQSVQPGMDPVKDVARILRLPGFYNTKQKDDPKFVSVLRTPPQAFWDGDNWSVRSES